MTKQEMLARLAAIIGTLGETNGSPESMLYIFFDMDMDLQTQARTTLLESKMIQIKSNFVTLTPSGKVTAQKINEAINK